MKENATSPALLVVTQQRVCAILCRFSFLLFCFYLSSSCDIAESVIGSAPLFISGQLTHRDASCVCIPNSFILFDCCPTFLLVCFSFAVCRTRCPFPCLPAWVVFRCLYDYDTSLP